MAEFTEPSILEYARFHGVASSSLASSDLADYISPDTLESLESALQDSNDSDFEIKLSTAAEQAKSKQSERLEIGRDGAIFLSSIIKPTVPPPPCAASTARHRVRNMKLDPPILQSDHELDMQAFSRGVISLDPSNLGLSPEQIEEENDEGLEWPAHYMDFPKQVWERARAEKLDCTREVLLFIQGVRDAGWDGVGGEVERVKKKKTIEPLTPPLLPLEPEPVPFVPSSPAARLEILSEPETPPVKEHVACQREVMEMDSIRVDDGGSNDEVLFEYLDFGSGNLQPEIDVGEPSTQKRVRGEDLKVEGPITPPISAKKRRAEEDRKSVGEILADNAPELLHRPCEADSPDGEILDERLVEIAQAAMDKVEARLSRECLRQVDSTTRVQVPELASSMIIPPWKATGSLPVADSKDRQQEFIRSMVGDYLKDTPCPMEKRVERSLQWVPFSLQRSCINVDEDIGGDDDLEFTHSPDVKDYEDSNNLLVRLGRLQILNGGDDSDEELLPVDIIPEVLPSSATAEETPASNETINIADEKPTYSPREEGKMKPDNTKDVESLNKRIMEIKRPLQLTKVPGVSMFKSNFSTTDSLSNFMEVRGRDMKRRKLESSPYFPMAEPVMPQEPTREPSPREDDIPSNASKAVESIPVPPLPFPDIPSMLEGSSLVLSTALLKSHRFIIHHFESMDPQHTLIFRDYTQFSEANKQRQRMQMHPSQHISPTSRTITEEDEGLDQEADIILSPSTAVLLTTSQATTQLYLPGHSPRNNRREAFESPLRERIAHTCVRYEQLYVLICHSSPGPLNEPNNLKATPNPPNSGNPEPTTRMTMDTRTVDSIRSLTSFCSSLSLLASVTPLIVPSQPRELMKWILGLAYKYTIHMPCISEQEQNEETPAEVFLRRAGLNPFAAHYVLTTLAGDIDGKSSSFAAFVSMDPRERRRRFAAIIGERLFSRVERKLEMGWDFV